MLDDKDVQKLIKAMKEVFPTAQMVKDSFDNAATKVQVQKIDERIKVVEQKLEDIGDLRPRVKKLEEVFPHLVHRPTKNCHF